MIAHMLPFVILLHVNEQNCKGPLLRFTQVKDRWTAFMELGDAAGEIRSKVEAAANQILVFPSHVK